MCPADSELQRLQVMEQRRKVDFDTYDVSVEELIRRVGLRRIDISPVYQRQFRWDNVRQSCLVESLILGIPVPPLFMATNSTMGEMSRWEVVDGLQRLLTLVNFAGTAVSRDVARLSNGRLRIAGLEKLPTLNGALSTDIPEDILSILLDRPVKVIVLNDKSDLQVRFDLFERLNTGGIKLSDQEVRECVYRGPFMDFVADISRYQNFRSFVHLPESRWKDGTPEEYVLRFFAFLEFYMDFDHSVKDFLNNFAGIGSLDPNIQQRAEIFNSTFDFLIEVFPEGLKTRKGMTPVNLFEGVAVGAALALQARPRGVLSVSTNWINSPELRSLTTGATNSRPRVRGRIEFCRDRFLGV